MTNHLAVLNGQKIVFIGGGNMAKALIDGLLRVRHDLALDIHIGVIEPTTKKEAEFAKLCVDFAPSEHAKQLLDDASVVVLAVKPQVMQEACACLNLDDKLVISVAAGLSLDKLQTMTKTKRMVRTMPNLPASIGHGATGLFAKDVSDEDKAVASAIMGASGIAVWVNKEDDLHVVTAVSGSAPAYFFYVLKHMIQKANKLGLDEHSARQLAVQTMQGSAMMAQYSDAGELQQKVTSKGGTTFAAITHMDNCDMGAIIEDAMMACYERSVELGL